MATIYSQSPNLLDSSIFVNNRHLSPTTGMPATSNGRIATNTPIDVSTLTNVCFSFSLSSYTAALFMYSIFSEGQLIERVVGKTSGDSIDVSNADELYLSIYVGNQSISTTDVQWAMLNSGNTPLPYEPYGYIWQNLIPKIYRANLQTWEDLPDKESSGGTWT